MHSVTLRKAIQYNVNMLSAKLLNITLSNQLHVLDHLYCL